MPMKRIAILTGLGVIVTGVTLTASLGPGQSASPATELSQMSDAEFGDRVRQYLLNNPEVIFEAADVMQQRQEAMLSAQEGALVQQHAGAIFDDGHSWIGGNPGGDVTIVQFTDYLCGYCRRAFPVVEELLASDGNIRIIMKEFPVLGEQSVIASRFAIAALQELGHDAYKALHDAIMSSTEDVSVPALTSLAETLSLDAQRIVAHMDSDAVSTVIAENRALGQVLQVSGTPTFIMQDRILRGYESLERMREIVEDVRG